MSEFTPGERLLLSLAVFAAVLGMLIGYVMPSTGTNILKDFLLFGGGCGVAFALAQAGARVSSAGRVRSLCNRSVQRLGLAASHARRASSSLRQHSTLSSDNTLQIIAASLDNLAEEAEVSIGDLEEMTGGKIDLDKLVSDALQQIQVAANKALPQEQADVKSKLVSALAEPLRKLEEQARLANVTLGLPKRMISCPNCSTEIFYSVDAEDGDNVIRNCFRCDERIYIDTWKGTVHHSEKRPPLNAIYVEQNGKAAIVCPSCMNQIRANLRPAGEIVKASCPRCTLLIHASREENGEKLDTALAS